MQRLWELWGLLRSWRKSVESSRRKNGTLTSNPESARSPMCVAVVAPVCWTTLSPLSKHCSSQGHTPRAMTSVRDVVTLLEGVPGGPQQQDVAQQVAPLPMRMGFLSASRTASAPLWASWADAFAHDQGSISADEIGPLCVQGHPPPTTVAEPGESSMAGNATLLVLLNTTSGLSRGCMS